MHIRKLFGGYCRLSCQLTVESVCLLFRCFAGTEFWLGLTVDGILSALQAVCCCGQILFIGGDGLLQLFSRTFSTQSGKKGCL